MSGGNWKCATTTLCLSSNSVPTLLLQYEILKHCTSPISTSVVKPPLSLPVLLRRGFSAGALAGNHYQTPPLLSKLPDTTLLSKFGSKTRWNIRKSTRQLDLHCQSELCLAKLFETSLNPSHATQSISIHQQKSFESETATSIIRQSSLFQSHV